MSVCVCVAVTRSSCVCSRVRGPASCAGLLSGLRILNITAYLQQYLPGRAGAVLTRGIIRCGCCSTVCSCLLLYSVQLLVALPCAAVCCSSVSHSTVCSSVCHSIMHNSSTVVLERVV